MPDHHFWLSDAQSARLQPLPPNKVRGVPRVDDRKVISGLIWRVPPPATDRTRPSATAFVRWSKAGVFDRIFQTLASESTETETVMIDGTHIKAHRTAASLLKKGLFRVRSGAPEAV